MLYVGIDLHRRTSRIVAMDAAGTVISQRTVASDRASVEDAFNRIERPAEAVFEATWGWGWLADLLEEMGIPAHMAHPLQTRAISAARVKNDAIDARTLAHLLRTNMVPESWIAPPEVREARRQVRMRVALGRIRTGVKQQVHALLGEHGIRLEHSDTFGVKGWKELEALQLPEFSRHRLDSCLRLITVLDGEIEHADFELLTAFGGDDRVARLRAIPGIGFLTAVTVLAEVGDISRFGSAAQLCSWAGLTPREHSSAQHIKRGHISKQGSRWLRWILVEAAATNKACKGEDLRDFQQRIAKRRGKMIARVAVARRLLTLCYYALNSQDGCRAYPLLR
jgi:transposase